MRNLLNFIRPTQTFSAIIDRYFVSQAFRDLAPSSQTAYRRVLERLRPIPLTRDGIETHLGSRTAGAAGDDLKKLRLLCAFARIPDPSQGIKRAKPGAGHWAWTDDEIAQYRAHWPLGSRPRLAFELALGTGQRIGDCRHMRWSDIRGGLLHVVQAKTRASLIIPLHPDLVAALTCERASPDDAIIKTSSGKPFASSASFALWFAKVIGQAGVPDRCVPHGLRKAAARRLAEAGCTSREVMAITGHTSLRQVEHYTRQADQAALARAALARLEGQP